MKPSILLLVFLSFLAVSKSRADIIVDFGTGANFINIPYSEDGLTITPLLGSAAWSIGPRNFPSDNRNIGAGANGFVGMRVTSDIGLINLISFDVEGVSAFQSNWRAVSSSGAEFIIPNGFAAATHTLPAVGWSGITHFDVFANAPNSGLEMDNIRFSAVPEPGSTLLLGLAGIAVLTGRRLRRPR